MSGIGLSWAPNIPSLLSASSTASKVNSDSEKLQRPPRDTVTVWKHDSELVDGLFVPPNDPAKLNKLMRKQIKDTTGKEWFDMPAPAITPELKRDLQLLKLRNVIDPKRHYKKGDSKSKTFPKYFQMGTVIESSSDFFSGRLTKKERKKTIAEELLSDTSLGQYRKRKVQEIQEHRSAGGVAKWKNKGNQKRKRAKHRRV